MRSLTPALALAALLLTACSAGAPSAGAPSAGAPSAGAPSTASPSPSASGPSSSPSAGPLAYTDRPFERLPVATTDDLSLVDGLDTWQAEVPGVQDVRVTSSLDASEQPVLWLPPDGEQRPLLVVLHSWSTRYVQHQSVPYGQYAAREGWAMVAPDSRGAFDDPDAAGSELALQDVLDAVDWALEQPGVDPRRVLVTGFSGGGMTALLLAGKHPDRFAGVVAWVPVYDLLDWYAYNEGLPTSYDEEIVAVCGGDPTQDPQARQACVERSPRTHLDAAREAGLPVYLGGGLSDRTVPPDAVVRAFDQLADPADRLGDGVAQAARRGRLPDGLEADGRSFFAPEDPTVLLSRESAAVQLVLFDGTHQIVYNPGLAFLAALPARG